jgi:hypothetical protein
VSTDDGTALPHLVHHHRHHHHHHPHPPLSNAALPASNPTAPEAPIAIRPKPERGALLFSALAGAAIALLLALANAYLR